MRKTASLAIGGEEMAFGLAPISGSRPLVSMSSMLSSLSHHSRRSTICLEYFIFAPRHTAYFGFAIAFSICVFVFRLYAEEAESPIQAYTEPDLPPHILEGLTRSFQNCK